MENIEEKQLQKMKEWRNHLDEMLPISRNLYKYISIKAQK